MTPTEIIALVAVLANIILVTIVIIQRRDSIKQYRTINRPWLIFGGGEEVVVDSWFNFHLENIGNLPAEKISIKSNGIFHYVDQADPDRKISEKPTKIPIIMPKQKHKFIINYLDVDALHDCTSYSIDVMVTYEFGNEKKMCTFQLYVDFSSNTREITCVEAD